MTWSETLKKIHPARSFICYGKKESVVLDNGIEMKCDYPDEKIGVGISSIKCDELPGVSTCLNSHKSTDDNTCKNFGLDMIVPRSEKSLAQIKTRYPSSPRNYFGVIPGIMKPSDKGYVSDAPMNSDFRGNGDFQSIDGGPWWLRDTSHNAPDGDYTAHCWLHGNPFSNPIAFNDHWCDYGSSWYICSTNEMSSYNLQAYKVIDPMTYDAHAQIVSDTVPSRIFEGNSRNYSPGTAETTENSDISFDFLATRVTKCLNHICFQII